MIKNGGYGLARKNDQTLKNYFQFMQMGYLINPLMVDAVKWATHGHYVDCSVMNTM